MVCYNLFRLAVLGAGNARGGFFILRHRLVLLRVPDIEHRANGLSLAMLDGFQTSAYIAVGFVLSLVRCLLLPTGTLESRPRPILPCSNLRRERRHGSPWGGDPPGSTRRTRFLSNPDG